MTPPLTPPPFGGTQPGAGRLEQEVAVLRTQVDQLTRRLDELANGSDVVRQDHNGRVIFPNEDRIEIGMGGSALIFDRVRVTFLVAGTIEIAAAQVQLHAPLVTASSVVRCSVLQATTVISATYSPGAGNVW